MRCARDTSWLHSLGVRHWFAKAHSWAYGRWLLRVEESVISHSGTLLHVRFWRRTNSPFISTKSPRSSFIQFTFNCILLVGNQATLEDDHIDEDHIGQKKTMATFVWCRVCLEVDKHLPLRARVFMRVTMPRTCQKPRLIRSCFWWWY